jgi:predicted ribosome quality control (RQC) complex YloA/Tae2 family protein
MRRIVSSFEEMHPNGWEKEDFARYVFENVSGLALSTAREIVARAEKAKMPLWAFIDEFCLHEPTNACVQYLDGAPIDFFAFPVQGGKQVESLHQAEDEYYYYKEYKKLFLEQKKKLESGAKTLKKKSAKRLQDILERLADAEKAEDNRIKGELLTANLYKIERGQKSVELDNWYDEQGGTIKIALDPLLTPAKNAQKYFKLYNKQKRAKEILTPMRQAEEQEIAYADSVLSAIQVADEKADLKEIEKELIDAGLIRAPKQKMGAKKKEEEISFRQFEHNGMKILLGRNNVQNDKLLRMANQDDIWLHAQKYHSSHAIIFTEGRQVCDETLIFAAQLCAYYSSGRDADKIPVDYCRRKFVKKPPKARAGFVIYTDYKTVLVKPTL